MKTTISRRHHSPEFKSEALKLASQTRVPSAAKQLGLQESQLYNWRAAASRKASQSEREATLATENARLKRQLAEQAEELAILKKAVAYFAPNQKQNATRSCSSTGMNFPLAAWRRCWACREMGITTGSVH